MNLNKKQLQTLTVRIEQIQDVVDTGELLALCKVCKAFPDIGSRSGCDFCPLDNCFDGDSVPSRAKMYRYRTYPKIRSKAAKVYMKWFLGKLNEAGYKYA